MEFVQAAGWAFFSAVVGIIVGIVVGWSLRASDEKWRNTWVNIRIARDIAHRMGRIDGEGR